MANLGLPHSLSVFTLPGIALLAALAADSACAQLTPESPAVKATVSKAIKFLESGDDKAKDSRPGAQALVAMAILKNEGSPNHPKVVQAVRVIQQAIRGSGDSSNVGMDIYSTGLSIIFLCTLEPTQYRTEILAMLKSLETRQKPHGGWGYPDRETGDTSMTQYGVLSMWEARQAGFTIPLSMVDNVADWLLRTQDPSGAYGYQGTVSNNYLPVPQTEVRHSMAAAGLGSLYISANILGLDGSAEPEEDKLPPALKEVKKGHRQPTKSRLDPKLFEAAKARGNRWMQANYRINPPQWLNYYLYALERYWSFREATEPKLTDAPPWYQDGAALLMKTQTADGSWAGQSGAVPDTAFAALFLLRSTKKSIERIRGFGPGVLVGGRGLPKGTTDILLQEGQVVAKPLAGPAQQLLSAIENAESPDHERAAAAMANLSIVDARKMVSAHEGKLRELVASGTPEARVAAVQALARSHDLGNIPTLIYAMNDPDPTVVLAARDALRRMSRKFDGFGLPDAYTEAQLRRAIERWKDWYRSIRPDAEFEE